MDSLWIHAILVDQIALLFLDSFDDQWEYIGEFSRFLFHFNKKKEEN